MLHNGHGVLEAASVLRGLRDTHGGLEEDLDGALGHVVVAVEFLVALLTHPLHQRARIGIKEVDETLQHVQVECWRDQFAVGAPFRACNKPPIYRRSIFWSPMNPNEIPNFPTAIDLEEKNRHEPIQRNIVIARWI